MNDPHQRPDPDALVQRLRAEQTRSQRTKLKLFFGFAPGVGKTFAMLESAQRLRATGVDVVVGCVETHGRQETAELLDGLEVLPRTIVEYRGAKLEELDLPSALARKPSVILIDELAHTNAPGQRHAKRYQDVLELLDAGIEVHTTLNVQHVESLNDIVAQITSVRVRETVPDAVLDRADEIELVDLPPEELLKRLAEGKVYLPQQAARAAEHFFQRGNLLALRELALRRTADRVDADVQAYREEHAIARPWQAAEKILVCIGPAPASARLVRAARRMAAGLRASWIAAYVEPLTSPPLSSVDRERLDAHLRLAESMGGQVARLSGTGVSEAILEYARREHITRIIIGKPTHPRFRDRLKGSLLDEVVRGSGAIDVHVISGDEEQERPAAQRTTSPEDARYRLMPWAAVFVAAATLLSWTGHSILAAPDIVMIYLVAIMLAATLLGRAPSLLASALSVAAYDFFFVEPKFTFAVSDTRHTLTFVVMFVVGLVISTLALRIRRQQESSANRELRTASLYALSRELVAANTSDAIAGVLARHCSELFSADALVVDAPAGGSPHVLGGKGGPHVDAATIAVIRLVLESGKAAGLGTDTLPGARVACFPVRSGPRVLAVLILAPRDGKGLDLDATAFLEMVLRQGALAFERARLADEAEAAALRAKTEELRSSLLSTVSHDLRTPLAVITGAATTLRATGGEHTHDLSPEQRTELLETICEEAEGLERLVGNLLDMTRLEAGGASVKREWIPLDELVGSALTRLEKVLGDRAIKVTLPAGLPMVPVDPVLFAQVFVNLLENAAKYTPPSSPIEIIAHSEDDVVIVEINDHGPGIEAGLEGAIFEKFRRGTGTRAAGAGLGLAICRGIVEAHGGRITASNREHGGASFRLSIPIVGHPPPMADDPRHDGRTEGA